MIGTRGRLAVSLQELVVSGCLEKCTISLNDSNHDSDVPGVSNQRCVNAAKVSQLLVQTLTRFDEEVDGADIISLSLDNIIVELSCTSVGSELGGDACGKGCEEFDLDVLEVEDGDSAPLDFNDDPFEHNDAPLDFLSSIFDMDGDHSDQESSAANEDHASILWNERSFQRSLPEDKDSFDKINASNSGVKWTVLGMKIRVSNILSPSESKPLASPDTPKMQHIGKLVYAVFSPRESKKSLSSIFKRLLVLEKESTGNGCNNETDLGEPHPKLQRHTDRSLFTDLVEIGHYPVSVCRMLSDMIDIGTDGMAESPFTSPKDVVDDLEQMSSHPWLYLDDPKDDGFSSKIHFGTAGCYGRTEQVTSILKVASSLEGGKLGGVQQSPDCVEAIFVSGVAGSGKSFFVQSVGNYLKNQGWLVLGSEFQERQMSQDSQDVVTSVFGKLVARLVSMRDGENEDDIKYSHHAAKTIADSLDQDDLASLANFISIRELFGNIGSDAADKDTGNSYWRLVFLLSSLLGAVLSLDRYILFYYDDLQWSDSRMLSLICELVISMGRLPHARAKFLFVGMYRDNEITNSHPFTSQYDGLKRNTHVNVTNINLPSLSKNDVTEMMMSETRLPRRLVSDFSAIIHKKTCGHPLFLVQLCNSLIRDSRVIYSPTKCRYNWNLAELEKLQTRDNVANFIITNLSSLSTKTMQSLRVLACLGMQSEKTTIEYLRSCPFIEGKIDMIEDIPSLVDLGILESSDLMVKFSHDILRQQVYHGIVEDKRRALHLCIGSFLGSNISFGIETTGDECREERKNRALASLATGHINEAKELVLDQMQRARFAGWNLHMSNVSLQNSNFQAAEKYCKNGLLFLGNEAWSQYTQQLSYGLFKGVAFSLLAEGKFDEVPKFAEPIIENVPFEDSIEANCILIRSLEATGSKNHETVASALALLRRFGFDIPSLPQLYLSYIVGRFQGLGPSIVKESMRKTDEIASKDNIDHIIDRISGNIHQSIRDKLRILDSVILAGLRSRSPYFPLIVCATVRYSLENGVCGESALSFCHFGCLKLSIEDNHKEAWQWGKMALKLLERFKHRNPFIRTRLILYGYLMPLSRSLKETCRDMLELYELGMKYGDVQGASLSLAIYLRYSMVSGERLSTLSERYDYYLIQMVKYSKESAKQAILDKISIDALMGKECLSFNIFDGMIVDENALLVDSIANKNVGLVHSIYLRRSFQYFWMGRDHYEEAMECSKLAFSQMRNEFPAFVHILHSAMKGLMAFQMYKQGDGTKYFELGKEMLVELEKWTARSQEHFPLKHYAVLLRAELYSSNSEVKKAKDTYKVAIEMASNSSFLAVANEANGHFLSSIVDPHANESFKNAYKFYMEWGAVTLAKKIQREQNLEVGLLGLESSKRGRDW